MKKSFVALAGVLLTAILFTGCPDNRSVYKIPLPQVPIKSRPTVKIITEGNSPRLVELARALGNEFEKNGGSVVDGKSDYWIVIYGTQAKRVDSPEDKRSNIIFRKETQKTAWGGKEVITSSNFSPAADAHFTSVTLYDVKTLTPMVNIDIPFYSSSQISGYGSPVLNSASRISKVFISTMNEILTFKQPRTKDSLNR